MAHEEIVYERRNDAGSSGISRPEARNAFRRQTLGGLAQALVHCPADFHQFRVRNKAALDRHGLGFEQGRNQGAASRPARQ